MAWVNFIVGPMLSQLLAEVALAFASFTDEI
jgi:hypothetical protein